MLSSQSKFGYINTLPKMRQYKQTGYILSRVGAKIIDFWEPKSYSIICSTSEVDIATVLAYVLLISVSRVIICFVGYSASKPYND